MSEVASDRALAALQRIYDRPQPPVPFCDARRATFPIRIRRSSQCPAMLRIILSAYPSSPAPTICTIWYPSTFNRWKRT